MKKIIPLVVVLLLQACSTEEESKSTPATESEDLSIIKQLYSGSRVPDTFYVWDVPDTTNYYATYHLKDAGGSEISVADYSQALALDAAENSALQLLDIQETNKYYEFIRLGVGEPITIYRSRIFKLSVIDRAGVVLNCVDCYWGKIGEDWLSINGVKELVEYIWYYTIDNNAGTVVLESYGAADGVGYLHTMIVGRLTRIAGACDVIRLYRQTYSVDINGGTWGNEEFVREILSEVVDNDYHLCLDN